MKRKLNKIRMWAVRIITALVILTEIILASAVDSLTVNGVVAMLIGLAWLGLILWANPQITKVQ